MTFSVAQVSHPFHDQLLTHATPEAVLEHPAAGPFRALLIGFPLSAVARGNGANYFPGERGAAQADLIPPTRRVLLKRNPSSVLLRLLSRAAPGPCGWLG